MGVNRYKRWRGEEGGIDDGMGGGGRDAVN